MQAGETKLRKLIEGTMQYVVPLFQRPYSWSDKQWKMLWADVLEQAKHDDDRPHFFGSIVTTPAKSVPQGVGKYLLIDGQQRITTVQVLLAAIRDCARKQGDIKLHDRINGQYLTNGFEEGDERLKVLPTQDDRDAFRSIIQQLAVPDGKLGACYSFFMNQLQHHSKILDGIHTAVVDRLSLVSITCDEYDNPHLIFEGLNAKGEKLTHADLIRNYLLMRVHVSDQDRLFRTYWLPIQQALGPSLTEFVRHFLMKEGQILKDADVYFELKARLAVAPSTQVERFLVHLHRLGMIYARFLDPTREENLEISEKLERIRRLKVTVAYPFLLRVFEAFEDKSLSLMQVKETLDLLESFVVRRSICNEPTNQLRRMLPPVFDAAGGASPEFVVGLRKQLGGKRCPSDTEFCHSLATERLYSTAEKNARLRLILERIERSFEHKEPADLSGTQIEHILPQTITNEWKEELGSNQLEEAQHLLHTIGNLTLTRYNAELSNRPYAQKRKDLYENSHFVLNSYFREIPRWSPEEIRERSRILADRAKAIWTDVSLPAFVTEEEKKLSPTVRSISFRDHEQRVSSWKDGFVTLLKAFEEIHPGLLGRIATEQTLSSVISHNGERFKRTKVRIGEVYVNTHASAASLRDWTRKVAMFAGIPLAEFAFHVESQTEPVD